MYYAPEIREYEPEDIPSMKALWSEVFRDPTEIIDGFFELLPSMGMGFVAECDAEILGAAYVLRAELWKNGRLFENLGYIYAVAASPEARGFGIGSELVRSCRRSLWEDGIELCCTQPAEASLFSWYEKSAGFFPAEKCYYEEVSSSDIECEIHELFADEYGFLRASKLGKNNYISYYYSWLLYAETIFKTYGGGFFRCGDSLACGYLDGDTLLIKELLGDAEPFIPALCRRLGAEKASIRRCGGGGENFIAVFEPEYFPPDTFFGITLD